MGSGKCRVLLGGKNSMDGDKRREKILEEILSSPKPLTGTYFSKLFDVSRQVIVQDIALLRAAGHDIIATPQGYMHPSGLEKRHRRTIACIHTLDQMKDELLTIVDLGGKVLDVVVEHPVYGEFKGQLMVSSRKDVAEFVEKMEKAGAEPLSALTEGVHIHTIEAEDEEILDLIEWKLAKKGLLLSEE